MLGHCLYCVQPAVREVNHLRCGDVGWQRGALGCSAHAAHQPQQRQAGRSGSGGRQQQPFEYKTQAWVQTCRTLLSNSASTTDGCGSRRQKLQG